MIAFFTNKTLRFCNTMLSVIVLALGVYIVAMPYLPLIVGWATVRPGPSPSLVTQYQGLATVAQAEFTPAENTLVIPKLQMQEAVFEGKTAAALKKGVWHRPYTSTPDGGSNTVLVGHRFTYTNPKGVFYSLDKVHKGDEIILYWRQHKYTYQVEEQFVVRPTAVEVEAATDKTTLTLYTCTPLWSAKDRLVVRAKLVREGL